MPLSTPVLARDLDGGLVGLQARAAEEDIGHLRALGQQLGQRFLAGHVVVVGGVDELGHLVLQRRHQLGVVVAQRVHCNAAQRIEVLLAVDVPHAAALASLQSDRYAAIGVHHVGRGSLNESGHCKNLLSWKVNGIRALPPQMPEKQRSPILGAARWPTVAVCASQPCNEPTPHLGSALQQGLSSYIRDKMPAWPAGSDPACGL